MSTKVKSIGPDLGWRAMFWIAIIPALLTLWIRRNVKESPIWLDRRRRIREAARVGRDRPRERHEIDRIAGEDSGLIHV